MVQQAKHSRQDGRQPQTLLAELYNLLSRGVKALAGYLAGGKSYESYY